MKEEMKNIIKHTVDNHSDDINPDLIWAGIENKMGAVKRKKRFGGVWLMCGIVFISVLSYVTYVFIMKSQAGDSIKMAVQKTITDNELTAENKELITNHKVNDIIDNNVILDAQKENILTRNTEKVEELNQSIWDHNAEGKDDSVEENEVSNEIYASSLNFTDLENENSSLYEKLKADIATDKRHDIHEYSEERVAINIVEIKHLYNDKLASERRSVEIEDYEEFVYPPMLVENENKFKLFGGIEVFSGISLGNKSITDNNQSYIDSRNENEELLEQWSAGVRFDVLSIMDFDIRSGVKYSMLTDRWMEENEHKDLAEYTYTKSRLIGGAIVVIDSMVVVDSSDQIIMHTVEQYNSQRFVSIPLEFSFGKSFNRFDIGLGFGIDVNYQLKDTHVIKNENGNAMVAKVGGKFVSPSFGGMVSLGYRLNDHWSITSRVNYRGLKLSDHPTLSTLRSNYKLYGLDVGLRYTFGK